MKIQDFCSKIRGEKNGLFKALRELQKIETQTLLDDGDTVSWDPWTPNVVSPQPVSA